MVVKKSNKKVVVKSSVKPVVKSADKKEDVCNCKNCKACQGFFGFLTLIVMIVVAAAIIMFATGKKCPMKFFTGSCCCAEKVVDKN
ncbi:MAG: hypothetical protein LBU68_02325 [Rickettsiales bacterium]|nr:hypothetical protein [Rickettsiales bacterium]